MRTAIDTNVISALWSKEHRAYRVGESLGQAQTVGGLVVCGAVYAELVAHPKASQLFVERFLSDASVSVDFDITEEIWQDATTSFAECSRRRRAGSVDNGPRRLLADFIVGSHALIRCDRLFTFDRRRYEVDYPKLSLWLSE